jgi:hypothetical protein
VAADVVTGYPVTGESGHLLVPLPQVHVKRVDEHNDRPAAGRLDVKPGHGDEPRGKRQDGRKDGHDQALRTKH